MDSHVGMSMRRQGFGSVKHVATKYENHVTCWICAVHVGVDKCGASHPRDKHFTKLVLYLAGQEGEATQVRLRTETLSQSCVYFEQSFE